MILFTQCVVHKHTQIFSDVSASHEKHFNISDVSILCTVNNSSVYRCSIFFQLDYYNTKGKTCEVNTLSYVHIYMSLVN